jgi:hypothetical protein
MKIDVTYGLIKNALIVNVYCCAEERKEKEYCEELTHIFKKNIESLINNTNSDDGDHLRGINFTKETKKIFENLIKKIIIDEITENYDFIDSVGLKLTEIK